MKTHVSHSLEETQKIAAQWLVDISRERGGTARGADQATVIGLSGHLGAGKTAFVKAVARELGIAEEVTSPTFVLMKLYDIPESAGSAGDHSANNSWPWKRLVHIDAYRLERTEELQALNWEQLVSDPHNLIMVEWPENVGLNENTEGQMSFRVEDGAIVIAF